MADTRESFDRLLGRDPFGPEWVLDYGIWVAWALFPLLTDSERKPHPSGRGSTDSTPSQTTRYDLSGCSTLSSPVLTNSMYASVRVWSVSSVHSFT